MSSKSRKMYYFVISKDYSYCVPSRDMITPASSAINVNDEVTFKYGSSSRMTGQVISIADSEKQIMSDIQKEKKERSRKLQNSFHADKPRRAAEAQKAQLQASTSSSSTNHSNGAAKDSLVSKKEGNKKLRELKKVKAELKMEINMMKAEDSKGVKEAADDGDKSIKDIEDADFENRNSDAGSNSTNNISPAASSSSSSIAAKTKVDKKGIANDIVNIKALELSAESEKETDFCGTNKQEKDDIIKVSDEKDLTVADNNEALEDNYYHHSDDNLSLSDKEAHRLRIFKRSRSSSSSSTSSSSSSSSSTSTSSSDYRRRRRHRKKSHRKGRKHGKKSKRSRKYRKSKTRRVSSSDSESDQTPSDNKAKIVKRNKELFPGKMYNYYEDFPNVEKVHPENEVFIDKDVLEKILKESKTVSLLIRDLVKAVFTQEALKGSTAQGYPNRVLGSKKLSRQVVLPRLDPDGRDAILKRAKIEQEKRKQWRPRVGHGSMSRSFSQAVKRCGKD